MKNFALAAVILAFILLPRATWSAQISVDLELVLAVDVSGSMDREEAALQRTGYVSAFRHPSVVEAIQRGPLGRIAVTYVEWGAYGNTHLVVDWTLLEDKRSADEFADLLEKTPKLVAQRTGISGAMDTGAAMLENNNYIGKRKVIDISGDGANNSGDLVNITRDRTVAKGITINGLPILNNRESRMGYRQIANLDLYYRDCVIGGPRAFHIVANSFEDFARAVLRKLVLEIADLQPEAPRPRQRADRDRWHRLPPTPLRHHVAAARKAPPCYIGEQIRRKRRTGDDGGWMPQFPYQ